MRPVHIPLCITFAADEAAHVLVPHVLVPHVLVPHVLVRWRGDSNHPYEALQASA